MWLDVDFKVEKSAYCTRFLERYFLIEVTKYEKKKNSNERISVVIYVLSAVK